ncbi:NAD(P)H-dependent glycerol-3-phosphate dehydrogenase [Candidatus Margulisiibacteriota bacterium]
MNKKTGLKISVIGAGAWGTTLAILLAENEHKVTLWAYEKEVLKGLKEFRENKLFLPGFQLPENIQGTQDPAGAKDSEILVFAVPTQFLRRVAARFKSSLAAKSIIVAASKGIEEKTLLLPLDILKQELKTDKLVALSGPNLSAEIARGMPAACVLASRDTASAKSVQDSLLLERFRVYINSDPLGVQLGGALKNVIALAAGVADGLELGNNAKAGLMIRGIAEIARLGAAMGADQRTFSGLSGMGDLITTCSSKLSRNHCVGEQIAKGKKLEHILKNMRQVAEGVATTKAGLALGKKHQVQLPVTSEVYQILYEGKDPFRSISDLMTRTPTSE